LQAVFDDGAGQRFDDETGCSGVHAVIIAANTKSVYTLPIRMKINEDQPKRMPPWA
jgi:hypothetical protein